MSNLLLKFREKDSPYGVTRKTLKAISDAVGISETMVVHLAVSRFAKEVLPAYDADEGPLPADYLAWLKKAAKKQMPKGRVISRKSLL